MSMEVLPLILQKGVKSPVSIGNIFRQKCQRQRHATVTIVLALATLGDVAQIQMILIAKASKEGDIALRYHWQFCSQTLPT